MKTMQTIAALAAIIITVSCGKNADMESPCGFDVTVSGAFEYERPTAVLSMSSGKDIDAFYPCQLRIDGIVEDALNAASTTVQAGLREFRVALPRMAPGNHTVEFILGRGRELYRDAESACGEEVVKFSRDVRIEPSELVAVALKASATDIDRYFVIPDEDKFIDSVSGVTTSIAEGRINPDVYTVSVFPYSLNGEFSVLGADGVSVEKVHTGYGNGISVGFPTTDAASFHLSFGGRTVRFSL